MQNLQNDTYKSVTYNVPIESDGLINLAQYISRLYMTKVKIESDKNHSFPGISER